MRDDGAGTRWPRATIVLVLVLVLGVGGGAAGQVPRLSGYYQNVAVGVASGVGTAAGALDAQRARLMWTPKTNALSFDMAYEHTLQWRDAVATTAANGLVAPAQSNGDWLDLNWSLYEGRRVSWRHRFDRLSASYTNSQVTATVGRQAVSWGTTLILTPADPFEPFDPSDPFREYRTGVDAARVQWFAGPFTVLDVVVRPANTLAGRTLTALARGKTTVGGWDLSAWAGAIHDAPGGAIGVTRTVARWAIRAEAAVRRDTMQRTVTRSAIGVDRNLSILGRDLYAVIEYQHDGLGAERASDLAAVLRSAPAERGELQVFGRDEAALQMSYQLHPLLSAELLGLWNLRDASALLSPAVSVSVSDEASLRVGLFAATGRGEELGKFGARSEYGSVPVSAYLAFSRFL